MEDEAVPMKTVFGILFLFMISIEITLGLVPSKPIRILVVTGGHSYKVEQFNQMLKSMEPQISGRS